MTACIEIFHSFRRSTAPSRHSAWFGAAITLAMGLLLMTLPVLTSKALTLLIAVWFAERRRGTAMGIWSAWVPIGSLTMLALGPVLAQTAGWQAVWWFGAAYAAVTTILFLVFVKPAPGSGASRASATTPTWGSARTKGSSKAGGGATRAMGGSATS